MSTLSEPKQLPQNKTQFTAIFTPDETMQAEEKAIRSMGGNVNVPGFRPGKAPSDVLKAKLRPEDLQEETIRILLPDLIGRIAKEQTLAPIAPPAVQVEGWEPLTVTITFLGKPEVKIKKLDDVKVKKEEPKVDEKDVDRMVKYILEQRKTMTPVDRAAQEGDEVTMDFVGVDEAGTEIEGTRSSGYRVRIGSKSLIPGFEEQLVGLKKDDEKSFQITFPEKYHAEHLRGKPATFTVKVTGVDEVQLPELTDEFAKEHLNAQSAAEFKNGIEQSMRMQEEQLDQQKREEALLSMLADHTEVDLAEELIDQEARRIGTELREQLDEQKIDVKEWMEQTNRTPESLNTELRDQAIRRLKLRFGLEKALEMKQIDLTPEEMAKLIQESDAPDDAKARMLPGTPDYEQLSWQHRVRKFMEMMLA